MSSSQPITAPSTRSVNIEPSLRTEVAALLVNKALNHEDLDDEGLIQRLRTEEHVRDVLRSHKRRQAVKPLRRLAVCSLLVITFLETPLWCDPAQEAGPRCSSEHYLTFQWNLLSCTEVLIVEFFFLLFLFADLFLWIKARGPEFPRKPWRVTHAVVLIAMLLDMVVAIFHLPKCSWRLSPYLRMLLLMTYSHTLQLELASLIMSTYEFSKVLLLTEVFVFVWAWFGIIIFPNQTTEGAYFETIGIAMWNLHFLLNANGWPDMLLAGYRRNKYVIIYFGAFLVVGVLLLLQMVTAVVVDGYAARRKQAMSDESEGQQELLKIAFFHLNEIDKHYPDHLTKEQVEELFVALGREDEFSLMFAVLDADGDKLVSEEEFREIVDRLKLTFKRVRAPPVELLFGPNLADSCILRSLHTAVDHEYLDHFVNGLLIFGAVINIVETWPWMTGTEDKALESDYGEIINITLTLIFVCEMIVKILFLGWDGYVVQFNNRFDAVATLCAVSAYVYMLLPNGYDDSELLRVMVMFRLFRVTRLVAHVPAFKGIFRSMSSLWPGVERAVPMFFCLLMLFNILGCDLFGGLITTDPKSKLAAVLETTSFGENDLYPLNFNDRACGAATLFATLFMGLDSYTDAYLIVGGNHAYVYFFSWWVVGMLAGLSLTTAIILDSWGGLATGERDVLSQRAVVFDASRGVTGTETGVQGRWMVRAGSEDRGSLQELVAPLPQANTEA